MIFNVIPVFDILNVDDRYWCISTRIFKFVDANNFLAPGTSYDNFFKSYLCVHIKSHFPYEWFNCETKNKRFGI